MTITVENLAKSVGFFNRQEVLDNYIKHSHELDTESVLEIFRSLNEKIYKRSIHGFRTTSIDVSEYNHATQSGVQDLLLQYGYIVSLKTTDNDTCIHVGW